MIFAGWAVAATFLPRLADLYGRKKIYICSLLVQFIFYLGIILSHDIKLTTAFNFFLGMASVGRATISYLSAMELIPKSKQSLIGTIIQIFNSFVTLFAVIFFYYISK
jgi:MFS family permease